MQPWMIVALVLAAGVAAVLITIAVADGRQRIRRAVAAADLDHAHDRVVDDDLEALLRSIREAA